MAERAKEACWILGVLLRLTLIQALSRRRERDRPSDPETEPQSAVFA
jgi:hypothetical protein